MHVFHAYLATAAVVILSLSILFFIMNGGHREHNHRSLAMFAATGFTTVLGYEQCIAFDLMEGK